MFDLQTHCQDEEEGDNTNVAGNGKKHNFWAMFTSQTPVTSCTRAAASTLDDKVTRSVKAAYKQACPLPDRKLGAAKALPCLICQQHSLPRRLITATMSDGVHNSMLDGCFDFSLCDTSVACHIVLCLSAS
ncbi:hypothetical protein PAMP_017826 [Pampus punctatissimus]